MAAYVIGAWLLVQIADTILPIYNASEWVLVAFVTLLFLGFMPAMIFAWLYNVTARGLEASGDTPAQARLLTTRSFQLSVAGVTTVLTAVAIWWVWIDYLSDLRTRKLSDNPVVAVTPIRNLSGRSELDWLGEGLGNLVRTNLAQSRHVVVVSNSRWESIVRGESTGDKAPSAADAIAAARDAGIEYVFSGEFIAAPAGLYLSIRLTDIANGVEKSAQSFGELTPESMLATGYRLSMLARQGLSIPHTESVDSFAADFIVNNMTAYEAYVGGLEYFRRFKYDDAEQAMSAALQLADDFHIARYRLAHIYMATGRQTEAVETVRAIPGDALFTPRERFYVDAARAFFELELDQSIATYKELLAEYPYEVEARQFLAELYFQNYQDVEAVDELRTLAVQEPENEFVWGSMGTYLVLSGRLDEAEHPLRNYYELALEKAHPLTMLGDLYRQQGEYQQASQYYSKALDVNPEFAEAWRGQAQVLVLLGEPDEAQHIWRRMIGDGSVAADERIYAAFDLASLLRSQERFRESLQPLESLQTEIHAERIRESMALATRGLSHLELGEADRARQLVELAIERNQGGVPTRYLFALGLLEIHERNFNAVSIIANDIRSHALPNDDPDRTEDRAADYLEGLALVGQGREAEAIEQLENVFSVGGYDYAIYQLGMARALQAAGQPGRAKAFAEQAASYRDASDVRLDLELERVRAAVLLTELRQELEGQKTAIQ